MADGDRGALFAAACGKGTEAGPQDRVFTAADRLGGDDETGAQPATAFAGLAAFAPARADVVARRHAGPTGEVGRRGELRHGGTDLGQEVFHDVKAEDAPKTLERLLKAYLSHRASPEETFLSFARRHQGDALRELAEAEVSS